MQTHVQRLRQASRHQWRRLRGLAKQSLHLKREEKQQALRRLQLQAAAERLAQKLAEIRDDRALAPCILDERRTAQDRGFIVTLMNAAPAQVIPDLTDGAVAAWRKGRRFVLWAVDEDRALLKIDHRFPKARGFRIVALVPEDETPPAAPTGPEGTPG